MGNPKLKPESSRGFEAVASLSPTAVRRVADRLSAAASRRDRRRLRSHHLPVQTPSISDATSHRSGHRGESSWQPCDKLRLSARTMRYLQATAARHRDRTAGHRASPTQAQRLGRTRTGRAGGGATAHRSLTSDRTSTRATSFPFGVGSAQLLLAGGCTRRLRASSRGSSCSRAGRTCSTPATRTSSAITPKARGFCGIRLRAVASGRRGSAIIAVNSHSAATSPSSSRPAGELADARALLDELDLEPEQDAGFDRLAELHAVDRHEIDELARAGEAEAFDREHARGLRQAPRPGARRA